MQGVQDSFASVDRLFGGSAEAQQIPGLAWGVVDRTGLLHGGGWGVLRAAGATIGDRSAGETPDPGSVFRIASITKSFTAAAVLLLRDEGAFSLDDAIGDHVSELSLDRDADAGPITVRHLLTMSSGLPTDDPWADRQLDRSEAWLAGLLTSGPTAAWPPGLAYEYSNLGYVILGRLIKSVTGTLPQAFIRDRLLEPMSLMDTEWDTEAIPAARRAAGHRVRDGDWVDEPVLGDGVVSPIGGLWSSVHDVARWIAWFLEAWPPPADADTGPLSRRSRREMQQMARFAGLASEPGEPEATGYGMGIAVAEDRQLGAVVGHAGGLPGFGSYVGWLPDRGVGVVALANLTYARLSAPVVRSLRLLAERIPRPPVTPSPELLEAHDRVSALIASWDPAIAGTLLADNVDLDEPLDRRAAEIAAMIDRFGPLTPEGDMTAATPMRGYRWSRAADGARVKVEIELSPTCPPRVQSLRMTREDAEREP